MPKMVSDPAKQCTDQTVLGHLARSGIDKDFVEFVEDYNAEHPTAKTYRDNKSDLFIATFGGYPKVNADGVKICGDAHNLTTVGWIGSGSKYTAQPNTHTLKVDGLAVEATSLGCRTVQRGESVGWEPRLLLNNSEVHPVSTEYNCLTIDPSNGYYHLNVLEMDYGFCKRMLREIEGRLFEWWILLGDPGGDVLIQHHHTGTMPFVLCGAWDKNGRFLEQENGAGLNPVINDDEELVPAYSLRVAEYPVTIGATLTEYTTSQDGVLWTSPSTGHDQAAWDDAHDAGDCGSGYTAYCSITGVSASVENTHTSRIWIQRGVLQWDLSAYSGTITAGDVDLYGSANTEADATFSDMAIVEGVQSDVCSAGADFCALRDATTLGSAYFDVSASWNTGAYNTFTLNGTGYGWLTLGDANAKLACRIRNDITDTLPTGTNQCAFWTMEKGAGYKPTLTLTFNRSETVVGVLATADAAMPVPTLSSTREPIVLPPVATSDGTMPTPTLSGTRFPTVTPPAMTAEGAMLIPKVKALVAAIWDFFTWS